MAVLQVVDDGGRAGGAVGLADEELGAGPAVVARGEAADELGDRLGVALHAVEVLALALQRLREARPDGIDEHEVGDVEDGLRVVGGVARRGQAAHVGGDAARPEAAHVQPHRRRAGPAVEAERERAPRGVDVAVGAQVGDVEHAPARLVGVVEADLEVARDGAVRHRLAGDRDLVLGGGGAIALRLVGRRGGRAEQLAQLVRPRDHHHAAVAVLAAAAHRRSCAQGAAGAPPFRGSDAPSTR
ncbi:MAG: hypothetical protein R3F59_15380 [Myxococcota bacterium]